MSKETDRYREEQEIRKAAELKAKLNMVEMRKKPTFGRAPKKVGTMICDTGLKNGHRNDTMEFVLRLDTYKGEFIAEHGDVWYVSTSRDALKAKMDEVARVTFDIEWTRYILVEYKAEMPTKDRWYKGTHSYDLDTKRTDEDQIYGIELSWEIVEYSNPIQLPGDNGTRWFKRDVDEDGDVDERQESVGKLPSGLIPYTKQREELLKQIREAFRTIDRKMVELFTGTPAEVAKRLDAVNGPLLLAAPAKKAKR